MPEPNRSGWSRIDANLRARVMCDPGSRLTALAEASRETAELIGERQRALLALADHAHDPRSTVPVPGCGPRIPT